MHGRNKTERCAEPERAVPRSQLHILMQDIQLYEEIAREADASIGRIARIFAEMGADAATMEKVRSIRSAADTEKEKYRKMTGRSI